MSGNKITAKTIDYLLKDRKEHANISQVSVNEIESFIKKQQDRANIDEDKENAIERLMKAAEQGDAQAQMDLAFYYHKGIIGEQNYQKAFKWFKKAAEQGINAA